MDDIDEPPDLPHYVPTPDEIAAVCREIQAGWTADEELRRRAFNPRTEVDGGRVHRVGVA